MNATVQKLALLVKLQTNEERRELQNLQRDTLLEAQLSVSAVVWFKTHFQSLKHFSTIIEELLGAAQHQSSQQASAITDIEKAMKTFSEGHDAVFDKITTQGRGLVADVILDIHAHVVNLQEASLYQVALWKPIFTDNDSFHNQWRPLWRG
jgi:hypothetical protein